MQLKSSITEHHNSFRITSEPHQNRIKTASELHQQHACIADEVHFKMAARVSWLFSTHCSNEEMPGFSFLVVSMSRSYLPVWRNSNTVATSTPPNPDLPYSSTVICSKYRQMNDQHSEVERRFIWHFIQIFSKLFRKTNLFPNWVASKEWAAWIYKQNGS